MRADNGNKSTYNWECDRCAKCCYKFNELDRQIHFKPTASFFQLSKSAQLQLNPNLVPIYLQIKDLFQRRVEGKVRYLIPTKRQIYSLLTEENRQKIPEPKKSLDECMFLSWDTSGYGICNIHEYNPDMCQNYPQNKGWACLNHYERRFTPEFLIYQRNQIGFAVQVVKELHRDKITDPISYEILTLLMDFGRFPLKKVQNFIKQEFNISQERFQRIIKQLAEFTLVSIIDNQYIEGISLKEVEKVVDQTMSQFGWKYPSKDK